jgi:NADH-quinone oxidoreductase subunit N
MEIAVVVLAVLGLLAGAFWPKHAGLIRRGLAEGALVVLVASFFLVFPQHHALFGGAYVLDRFAILFKQVLLGTAALVLLLADAHEPLRKQGGTEFSALVLLATAGMMLLTSANDFIFLFVALELVTISFYVLNGFLRGAARALEAGLKYLVLGALAAGFMAYGIAYIFGATGSLNFDVIHHALHGSKGPPGIYQFGFAMVLLGLGFKLAMVPMQLWAPDVYQGAPTPAAAFLASGSKIAGFVVLLRLVFADLLPPAWEQNPALLMALAAITLLYGALGGLAQTDIKRLLGYSSIANAGFLLLGFAAGGDVGHSAVIYYLVPYLFAVIAVFAVLTVVANANDTADRATLAGLHHRSPLLALALLLAMLSLAGIPPLGGALGKFFLLLAVLLRARADPAFYALAGIAVAGAVIALCYYLRVLRGAWADPAPDAAAPIAVPWTARVVLFACMAGMLVLGVWPLPLLRAAIQCLH